MPTSISIYLIPSANTKQLSKPPVALLEWDVSGKKYTIEHCESNLKDVIEKAVQKIETSTLYTIRCDDEGHVTSLWEMPIDSDHPDYSRVFAEELSAVLKNNGVNVMVLEE